MAVDPNERTRLVQRLREELREQTLRTRQLLEGEEDEAAEGVLGTHGIHEEVEERIAVELASDRPLADPAAFPPAHRRVMHALEVLHQEGARSPKVPSLLGFGPLVKIWVEDVAGYIVSNYADDVLDTLRGLYARRLVWSEPRTPERGMLRVAHREIGIVSPDYGGGGALLRFLIGSAAVPIVGWLAHVMGVVDFSDGWLWLAGIVVLAVVFFTTGWVLLRGAATAHRRSRLIMDEPLAALWETVGHCGRPPEDDGRTFAMLVIVLMGSVWFVLPVITALVLLLW